MTYDNINPSHYRGDRKFEPIEVIEDWGLNYHLGNAVKYISRNGRKPSEDPREGLRKAIWYLEREIKALGEPESPEVSYEDVLTYYGESEDLDYAWPETSDFWAETGFDLYVTGFNTPPRVQDLPDVDDQPLPWDTDDDYMWDPSLGPVELTDREVAAILRAKDLKQFQPDEIVATIEKRGFVLGVRKDGSTCELGMNGTCQ